MQVNSLSATSTYSNIHKFVKTDQFINNIFGAWLSLNMLNVLYIQTRFVG